MSRRLTILPAPLGDIAQIGDWYDLHNNSLPNSFLKAVDESLSQLVRNPLQYQLIYRRVPVKRFPYALYYLVSDDAIIVAACIHGRRNVTRMLRQR